ncbi:hypothetical protein I4F81_011026 [Pyropia yezoensis]|uniref:Uncharacterized protein n=1 Tax=Pyropia yezoensis TaxID=2788 RepID=A0ACC3CEX5_PYRYE|nr:hypothetical protein I4F81_011026 [Neopyropia yezoensis]
MSVWKAFWQKGERYKRADGSMSKNWVAYCFECEAAHEKYRGAVAACNGEDEAIANIGIVPPAEPLSGPADWMAPHLSTCQFLDASILDVDAGGRGNRQSDAPPDAALPPPTSVVSQEPEQDLCRRLGLSSAQFHARSVIGQKADLDKRLLLLVADRRLPFRSWKLKRSSILYVYFANRRCRGFQAAAGWAVKSSTLLPPSPRRSHEA